MKVLKKFDLYDMSLYDASSCIIYNDEKLKKKVIDYLENEGFIIVDSVIFSTTSTVKDFLKETKFPFKLIPEFDLKRIITKKISDISYEDFIFIKVLAYINLSNSTVVLDDVLTFLSTQKKKTVLNFAKSLNVTIYNFTSDEEEVLYFPYLICLAGNKVAIEGPTKTVVLEEKILKRLGFNLPFVVDLSIQLKCYGVIDTIYYDIDKLVKELWKKKAE